MIYIVLNSKFNVEILENIKILMNLNDIFTFTDL